MALLALLAFLAGCAIAQTTTSAKTKSVTVSSVTYPVVSIFLPFNVPEFLGASVITAGPSETVFSVDCMTKTACKYNMGFKLTGGESTFVCTNTYLDPEGSADSPVTYSCDLTGGLPANLATCTLSSTINGLGDAGSTTTFSYNEITYAPLTITAGEAKLKSIPTVVPVSSSSSSSAMACEITAGLQWMVGGAAAALLGVL